MDDKILFSVYELSGKDSLLQNILQLFYKNNNWHFVKNVFDKSFVIWGKSSSSSKSHSHAQENRIYSMLCLSLSVFQRISFLLGITMFSIK